MWASLVPKEQASRVPKEQASALKEVALLQHVLSNGEIQNMRD